MTHSNTLRTMGYLAGLALVLALGLQQPARPDTGDFLGGVAAGVILNNALDGPRYQSVQYGYVPYGYREVCRWAWSGGRQVLQCTLRPDSNYGYGYYGSPGYGFGYSSPSWRFDYWNRPRDYHDPWSWNRRHSRWHRQHPRW